MPQGGLDGGFHLVGFGLPRPQANGGDLGARVEGVGLAGERGVVFVSHVVIYLYTMWWLGGGVNTHAVFLRAAMILDIRAIMYGE